MNNSFFDLLAQGVEVSVLEIVVCGALLFAAGALAVVICASVVDLLRGFAEEERDLDMVRSPARSRRKGG